jgi:hypothetical protein
MSKIIEINNFLDSLLIPRLLWSKDFLIILYLLLETYKNYFSFNDLLFNIAYFIMFCKVLAADLKHSIYSITRIGETILVKYKKFSI